MQTLATPLQRANATLARLYRDFVGYAQRTGSWPRVWRFHDAHEHAQALRAVHALALELDPSLEDRWDPGRATAVSYAGVLLYHGGPDDPPPACPCCLRPA